MQKDWFWQINSKHVCSFDWLRIFYLLMLIPSIPFLPDPFSFSYPFSFFLVQQRIRHTHKSKIMNNNKTINWLTNWLNCFVNIISGYFWYCFQFYCLLFVFAFVFYFFLMVVVSFFIESITIFCDNTGDDDDDDDDRMQR